jgi:hypothetical protein
MQESSYIARLLQTGVSEMSPLRVRGSRFATTDLSPVSRSRRDPMARQGIQNNNLHRTVRTTKMRRALFRLRAKVVGSFTRTTLETAGNMMCSSKTLSEAPLCACGGKVSVYQFGPGSPLRIFGLDQQYLTCPLFPPGKASSSKAKVINQRLTPGSSLISPFC